MSRRRGGSRSGLLVALTAAMALAPLTAEAQLQSGVARVGGLYQSFQFDDGGVTGVETLSLLTVPVNARVPLTRWARVDVAGAWADGSLETADGSTISLSGFTDTRVSLTFGTPGSLARVSVFGLLPTGESEQTLDETRVAGALATDLLPFAVSNWGSGGGAGGSISLARTAGSVGLGLAVSYLARQSFEPLAGEAFAYRPGDLLQVSAAVDGPVGDAAKATLQATYNRYGDDEFGEENLFQSGDRYQVTASLAFPVGAAASGITWAGVLHRDQGAFLDGTETASAQDLVLVGGGLRFRTGGIVLQPDVQGRFFRQSEGEDQGWDLSAGVDLEIPAGGTTLVPSVAAHVGNLQVVEGVESSFTGFEAGLSVRFGGGR